MQKGRNDLGSDINSVDSLSVVDGKIDANEFKTIVRNNLDSSQLIGPAISMPALDFNAAIGTWQSKTLLSNSTLTISNAKAGEFYEIEKSGAFTLTLPSSGNKKIKGLSWVVPSGNYLITFGFNGTYFVFNYNEIEA